MPSAQAPGFLLDAYSRPAIYTGGQGNLYRRTRDDDEKRPRGPNLFADYLGLLAPGRYHELVSECRNLAARGLVHAGLEQRSDYHSGSHYRPTFLGRDEAFGADLLAALDQALGMCNLRGPRFDWRATWRLGPITRATDGSYFILLTEWADSGWPALQVFEGHRIWQRDLGENVVGKDDAFTILADGSRRRGVYAGLTIRQGIIYNAAGQEVAYRVLGPDPDGEDDQDISARDMIHVSRPGRHSEGRPAPDLAAAVLDFIALDLAQTAQLDQQIIDARQTLVESNASGKAPAAGQILTGTAPANYEGPTEVYERGGKTFIKSGYQLTPWETERPSAQWMNFDSRVASRAFAAIRWRVEMLDPEKIGSGAANRAFQDQINTTIQDEFSIDAPAITRVLRYFAAKLIKQGALPNHPEAAALGVAPPPWFEVDRNSSTKDLEDVAAGRTPMSRLHQRDGTTTLEVYNERARAWLEAKGVSTATGVPLEIIMGDLGNTVQRTGGQAQQSDQQAA